MITKKERLEIIGRTERDCGIEIFEIICRLEETTWNDLCITNRNKEQNKAWNKIKRKIHNLSEAFEEYRELVINSPVAEDK